MVLAADTLVAAGLSILMGYAGQISLGQGAFLLSVIALLAGTAA